MPQFTHRRQAIKLIQTTNISKHCFYYICCQLDMSVSVQNISKLFGEQKAVNDISFEANRGEIVGFLGPNGAGKSTTMKMITGYLRPDSGTIEVCGIPVKQDDVSAKQKIGYLPESNPLYYDLYVREYLEYTACIHNIIDKRKRVQDILMETGLQPESHKKIGELSKGYKQRVGLAQALIHNPEVLILDEPTSGLDPNQLREIRSLIKSIGQDRTVIFSTHIMQEVQALCDRVLIINKGRIVADDPINELENHAKGLSRLTVEFDKEIDREILKELPSVHRIESENDGTWVLHYDGNLDIRPQIFDLAVKQGVKLLELRRDQKSVEDIFELLTKNEN